ncbi:MAG TPA: hypothetical protein VMT10_03640 [Solirubrobacteraceae bacterium]|nr:hypothetical protein [Solirubrobacteraceae bacterium]
MTTHRRFIIGWTTIALLGVSLAGAGCGGSGSGGSASVQASTAAASAGGQYVASVEHLHNRLKAALGGYYHSNAKGSAIQPQVRHVLAAYRAAAAGLAAIKPPPAAAAFHGTLLATYRTRATELAALLRHKPFDDKRVSDVLVGQVDRDEGDYEQIYTLPQ